MNPTGELKRIKLADLVPSTTNPRKNFKTADWPDFVDSIRNHGVQQPGVARPHPTLKGKFELCAGERRWRASAEAKLPDMPVLVHTLTDEDMVERQQIENLQREDLGVLEEAQGYADWRDRLLKNKTTATVEAAVEYIAGRINRKRSTVYGRLALLKASPAVQKALGAGTLDASKAGLLAQIPDPKLQDKCLKEFNDGTYGAGPMSFRGAQKHLAENYRANLKDAGFGLDAELGAPPAGVFLCPSNGVGKLVTCTKCPLRSGNMANLYPEFARTPNICTNPPGFKLKTQMHTDATLNRLKAEGKRVIGAAEYERNGARCATVNDKCYSDPKYRTYGQLAKAAKVDPVSAVDETGKVVEVFPPEDIQKIKTANKISFYHSSKRSPADKKREQKKKDMKAAAMYATGIILEKLVVTPAKHAGAPPALPNELWPLLAQAAYDVTDISKHDFTAKRRGLAKTINETRTAIDKWFKQPHTAAEYARFTVEVLLCADWEGEGWHECKWSKPFQALCKLARVNLDKAQKKTTASSRTPRPKTAREKAIRKGRK